MNFHPTLFSNHIWNRASHKDANLIASLTCEPRQSHEPQIGNEKSRPSAMPSLPSKSAQFMGLWFTWLSSTPISSNPDVVVFEFSRPLKPSKCRGCSPKSFFHSQKPDLHISSSGSQHLPRGSCLRLNPSENTLSQLQTCGFGGYLRISLDGSPYFRLAGELKTAIFFRGAP